MGGCYNPGDPFGPFIPKPTSGTTHYSWNASPQPNEQERANTPALLMSSPRVTQPGTSGASPFASPFASPLSRFSGAGGDVPSPLPSPWRGIASPPAPQALVSQIIKKENLGVSTNAYFIDTSAENSMSTFRPFMINCAGRLYVLFRQLGQRNLRIEILPESFTFTFSIPVPYGIELITVKGLENHSLDLSDYGSHQYSWQVTLPALLKISCEEGAIERIKNNPHFFGFSAPLSRHFSSITLEE
jgi:hypothetical protein